MLFSYYIVFCQSNLQEPDWRPQWGEGRSFFFFPFLSTPVKKSLDYGSLLVTLKEGPP